MRALYSLTNFTLQFKTALYNLKSYLLTLLQNHKLVFLSIHFKMHFLLENTEPQMTLLILLNKYLQIFFCFHSGHLMFKLQLRQHPQTHALQINTNVK